MNTLKTPLKFRGKEYIDSSIGHDLAGAISAVIAACDIEKKLSGGKADLNSKAWRGLIRDINSVAKKAYGG